MEDVGTLPLSHATGARVELGGLIYRHERDGWVCAGATDRGIERCSVAEGTVRIAEKAFAGYENLACAQLPGTVRAVGRRAFAWCGRLTAITLPDGLEALGEQAFYRTRIAHLRIPAALRSVGEEALSFCYDDPAQGPLPPDALLHCPAVEVDPENPAFYLRNDVLCQWLDAARTSARAVLYTGDGGTVELPEEVTQVAAKAFYTPADITELVIHRSLAVVEPEGFRLKSELRRVRLVGDGAKPDVLLYPPPNFRCANAFKRAFASRTADLNRLVYLIDYALRYNKFERETVHRMLERMENGVGLDEGNRTWYRHHLDEQLDACVLMFARAEDTASLTQLMELDFINSGNINHVVSVTSKAHCVKATGHLLHEKRRFMGSAHADYAL